MSIFTLVVSSIVYITGIWLALLILCSFTSVQRQVFYAHRAPISRGQQLDKPETFGYLKNQVATFKLTTLDRQQLYAWLVAPLKVYLQHETVLIDATGSGSLLDAILKLIAKDPEARLVVYFHGNAGTVGQTRRTEAYRSITAGDSDHVYVLAFDYRGFGKSSGKPTEAGLITDALSVLQWTLNTANLPPENVVLVAQSLGTALATAALDDFARRSPPIEFGGLVLCAPFINAAEVLLNYRVLGFLPLMAPVRQFSWLRRWFVRRIKDNWVTSERLKSLVSRTKRLRLTMIQATNDQVIPFHMLGTLTHTVLDELQNHVVDSHKKIDLGEGGIVEQWRSGERVLRKIELRYGGHNTIMKCVLKPSFVSARGWRLLASLAWRLGSQGNFGLQSLFHGSRRPVPPHNSVK